MLSVTIEDAAERLKVADRILVIGCSGGGKSTLSLKIARRFGIPYHSLDRDVRWLSGWQERPRENQRSIMKTLVAHNRWIMDGSGASSFDVRLPRTDLVIWIRMPRLVCLLGIASRVWRYRGTVRPEMADGCPEPLPDRDFLSYIWNFEKTYSPLFIRSIEHCGPQVPIVTLKSRGEIGRLLDLASAAA